MRISENRSVARLPDIAVFEQFLRQKGELWIGWPTIETRRNASTIDPDMNNKIEDISIKRYRLFLDGEDIGIYTQIREARLWGRLRRMSFRGHIPGYKFRVDNKEMEALMLDYVMKRSRKYSGIRFDNHKSIPFHYSAN